MSAPADVAPPGPALDHGGVATPHAGVERKGALARLARRLSRIVGDDRVAAAEGRLPRGARRVRAQRDARARVDALDQRCEAHDGAIATLAEHLQLANPMVASLSAAAAAL